MPQLVPAVDQTSVSAVPASLDMGSTSLTALQAPSIGPDDPQSIRPHGFERPTFEPRHVCSDSAQPMEVWLVPQSTTVEAKNGPVGCCTPNAWRHPPSSCSSQPAPCPSSEMVSNPVQLAQLLHHSASPQAVGSLGNEASLFQQPWAESFRQAAVMNGAVAANANLDSIGTGPAAQPALGCSFPLAMDMQVLTGWASWLQQVQTGCASGVAPPRSGTTPADSSAASRNEEPSGSGRRVEELNNYIRQQAQEYVEGQAEWSRQIAEVKADCERENDKVKREKREVERQARDEILRLRQRLRDAGLEVPEEAESSSKLSCSSSPGCRPVEKWSVGVSMDDFNEVQQKLISAEERIKELQKYIKEQSVKQVSNTEVRSSDKCDDLSALRQALDRGNLEIKQAHDELEAVKAQEQQKAHFWEQAIQHLLTNADQFLSSQFGLRQSNREEIRNSRFGRTAKKLALTLPTQSEGDDVGALKRILKDELNNGKERTVKMNVRGSVDSTGALAESMENSSDKTEDHRRADDGKVGEGDGSPSHHGAGTRASCGAASSDSNPSSRETSPSRGLLRVIEGHPQATSAAASLPDAKVAHFVTQLSNDLRSLLAMNQTPSSLPTTSATACPSQESSPRSVRSEHSANAVAVGHATRQRGHTHTVLSVNPKMALHLLFQLSTLLRSAVGLTLRRNIGMSAVLFNRAKELDPIQKLFLDKIRDYNTKSKASGGVVDAGPSFQKNMSDEIAKLEKIYGGGDLTKFPDFKFTEPKLTEVPK